jgi:hypothetical protein
VQAGQVVWIPYGFLPQLISIAKNEVSNFVWLPVWSDTLYETLPLTLAGGLKGSVLGLMNTKKGVSKSEKLSIAEVKVFFTPAA